VEPIYELGLANRDGSLYTRDPVMGRLGKRVLQRLRVAAEVRESGRIEDARERLDAKDTEAAWISMDAVAFVLIHN